MQFIASLDIGTTTIRCHIINSDGEEVSAANGQITLLYPEPGFVEINPDDLWENTIRVIKEAIKSADLQPTDIKCLAISTQRCTFLTWDRYTGKYFHNFITWKDVRADSLVKQHNTSFPIKCLRAGSKLLYTITRNKRFLAGSVLKLMNAQMADQSASLYGSCCFKEGDMKVTMGTGTFLDVNTGCKPHASVAGLYPVVGWRVKNELVYIAEGSSYDTGCLIQWIQEIGLIKDPSQSSYIAYSVPNSDGVYFTPAFSGLQAPVNDSQAATGFLGIKPTTKSEHLVRAVLESIAFRVAQLYILLKEESNFKSLRIRVDGGVSNNDFIVQLLSNLTGIIAERPLNKEMSVFGAAYLAGLVSDIWKDKSQLISLRKVEREFKPIMDQAQEAHRLLEEWNRAVQRFLSWSAVF